jgi:hypothetical protein
VTLRYASAVDMVQIMNRLLAESGQTPGVAADPQQRVTLVADPRSNSILVRAENSVRMARGRSLLEQLDTQGRAGGNIFIIYLKNAEAIRVAATLRSLLTGSGGDSGASAGLSAITGAAALGATSGSVGSTAMSATGGRGGFGRLGRGRRWRQWGWCGFTAGGVTIQADAANNALLVMAPEPVYNNIRAIVEKLDNRRAQVFVEALIVEISADRSAEFGIQWQYLQGAGNTSSYVGGGTNFGARNSGNNIIDTSANLGSAGNGLNLGIIRGSITIPGLGTITNLACWCGPPGRQHGQHPRNAESTHARQRGSEDRRRPERAVHYRTICTDRFDDDCDALPDHRTPGCRPDTSYPAADHGRRHGAAGHLRGSIASRGYQQRVGHHHQFALARVDGIDRGRPDHRPWGLIQDSQTDGTQKLPFLGDVRRRRAVSLRHARAQQDQPDGIPPPDHRSRRRVERRDHQRPLRLHHRRAEEHQAGSDRVAARLAQSRLSANGLSADPDNATDTAAIAGAVAVVPAVDAGVTPSGDTQAVGNSAIGLPTAGRAVGKIDCHKP